MLAYSVVAFGFIAALSFLAMSGPLDKFVVKTKRNNVRRYNPSLSLDFCVYDEDINLNIKARNNENEAKVKYTYSYNIDLLDKTERIGFYKGYPTKKNECVELIKSIYGDTAITIGNHTLFENREKHKRGYVRCNICIEYNSHFLSTANISSTTNTIASKEGRIYKIEKMINHFAGSPHDKAVLECRSSELLQFLQQNPSENVNNYTENELIRNCIDVKHDIYLVRLKHICMVYNDMKCLTLSGRTFASRDLIDKYVQHCIDLKDEEFKEFIPDPTDIRYNNPNAHKVYRTLISNDITDTYVKPLFSNVIACGVAYDGWRAFNELYIHGARLVFKNGEIMHVFIGLVDPTNEGAAGCTESFRIAYFRLFDNEEDFNEFLLTIVSQTTDKAAINTGNENGANIQIRTDVINNPELPEFICVTHCGHNSFKDLYNAFGIVERVILDHINTVSYSHRGEISKDFGTYCVDIIFKDSPKEEVYDPSRFKDAGLTRMESHLFASMKGFHDSRDCWMLFIDDRSSNGKDTKTRVAALYQWDKLVHYKKMRINYLIMDCLRFYSIFDKCGQIVGVDVLQMQEYRDKLTNNLKTMKTSYGVFETCFYKEMISIDEDGDYLIYGYFLTHKDVDHLETVTNLLADSQRMVLNISSDGTKTVTLLITSDDKTDCQWLTLRDDIIQYFIDRIIDRCFDHAIIKYIKSFDPRIWSHKFRLLGDKFINEYLNDEIIEIVKYWKRINANYAQIGIVIVKQFYMDHFMRDAKYKSMTLTMFGQIVLNKYQHDSTMVSVCQLYGSFMGIMPSGMILENWNSFATLIWRKHCKSTTCHSIHEFCNVKVNGPSTNNYDARRPARKITSKSRWIQYTEKDVEKHMDQPYIRSFFHSVKQNQSHKLDAIKTLENISIKNKNISNINPLIKDIKRSFQTKNGSFKRDTNKYQTNITSYLKQIREIKQTENVQNEDNESTEYQYLVLNNMDLTAYIYKHLLHFIEFDQIKEYKVVSQCFYVSYYLMVYRDLDIINFYNVEKPEDWVYIYSATEHKMYQQCIEFSKSYLKQDGILSDKSLRKGIQMISQ